jgi:hypothetical protein
MSDDGPPDAAKDFDRWAELSARLMNTPVAEQAAILEAAELDEDVWAKADARWLAVLAADLGAAVLERAERYGQICAREVERRAAEGGVPLWLRPDVDRDLQKYAAFCAEITIRPDDSPEILARYGVAEQSDWAGRWSARFEAAPELRTLWVELCVEYRDWFQRRAAAGDPPAASSS